MEEKRIYIYEIPYRNKHGKMRKVLHVPDKYYQVIMYLLLFALLCTGGLLFTKIISNFLFFVFMGGIWIILFPMLFLIETDTMKEKRENCMKKEEDKKNETLGINSGN